MKAVGSLSTVVEKKTAVPDCVLWQTEWLLNGKLIQVFQI